MQAVPQCFVQLGDIVGKQQTINNTKEQLLGFRCGQQGAPVLHYATCTIPKTATLIHLKFLYYNVAKASESVFTYQQPSTPAAALPGSYSLVRV